MEKQPIPSAPVDDSYTQHQRPESAPMYPQLNSNIPPPSYQPSTQMVPQQQYNATTTIVPSQMVPQQQLVQIPAGQSLIISNQPQAPFYKDFTRFPVNGTCKACNQTNFSTTETEAGCCTYTTCVLLSTVLCCCVAFCMDWTKDIIHKCPACKRRVGRKPFW